MLKVFTRTGFDFSSTAYQALFARSVATAFQHPVWLERLYRHLAPELGAEPLVVTVEDGDGTLLMVLPLVRRRRNGLRAIEFADLGVSDYASPVCSALDFERICSDGAVLSRIAAALRPYDILRVTKVRADGLDLSRLLPGAASTAASDHAHAVRLGGTFEEWRDASIAASYRRELDKKRRKLGRRGDLRLLRVTEPGAIADVFEVSLAFRRPRFEHRGTEDVLADPAAMTFYLDVAAAGAVAGFARTYGLTLDGRTIGTLFGLSHRRRLLVLMTAFDAELKSLSIGSLLFEDVVADCIREGDDVFDLTVGDESYKSVFGAFSTDLATVLASGSVVGRVARLALSRHWGTTLVKGLVGRSGQATPSGSRAASRCGEGSTGPARTGEPAPAS